MVVDDVEVAVGIDVGVVVDLDDVVSLVDDGSRDAGGGGRIGHDRQEGTAVDPLLIDDLGLGEEGGDEAAVGLAGIADVLVGEVVLDPGVHTHLRTEGVVVGDHVAEADDAVVLLDLGQDLLELIVQALEITLFHR